MKKSVLEMLNNFSQELSLDLDQESGMVHGQYKGYPVCLVLEPSGRSFTIITSAIKNGEVMLESEAKALNKAHKPIQTVTAQNTRIELTTRYSSGLKNCANAKEVLEILVDHLRNNGYEGCCQICSSLVETNAYYVNGNVHHMCPQCFTSFNENTMMQEEQKALKKDNLVSGIIGALLGSLLGAISIVIIGQLGYVAAISGLIMGVCTLKGYELLGGKITKKGIAVSVIFMVLMVYVGNRADWALAVADAFEVGFFEAYSAIPELITAEVIDSSYYTNLVMVYMFTVLGAYPTIGAAIKQHTTPQKIYQLTR